MGRFDKISYPNSKQIDQDTLHSNLENAIKIHLKYQVYLLLVIDNGVYEIYIVDNHYNDIIKIIIQRHLISLQLTRESTEDQSIEAVNKIYEVVKDLFSIWFT